MAKHNVLKLLKRISIIYMCQIDFLYTSELSYRDTKVKSWACLQHSVLKILSSDFHILLTLGSIYYFSYSR